MVVVTQQQTKQTTDGTKSIQGRKKPETMVQTGKDGIKGMVKSLARRPIIATAAYHSGVNPRRA
jgi:hypothetical protein